MITIEDLKAICPATPEAVMTPFVVPLNDAIHEFDIDQNPARESMFLAQVAHESRGFRYVKELASGRAYEGRTDLGNTVEGDGVRFKGRGLIQITGRSNYRQCGIDLGVDLESDPELLERPDLACRSAAWFWHWKDLNKFADRGDFVAITRRINGGMTGYESRVAFYDRARKALV